MEICFSITEKQTCSIKDTTKTDTTSVVVSKSWKFKSIACPIIQPRTTEKGICSNIVMVLADIDKIK